LSKYLAKASQNQNLVSYEIHQFLPFEERQPIELTSCQIFEGIASCLSIRQRFI
jgi:hypothetical protein